LFLRSKNAVLAAPLTVLSDAAASAAGRTGACEGALRDGALRRLAALGRADPAGAFAPKT
jgi:hypothetical protein